jgi:glycosyltransferase involved in cell wall biosynthesis
MNELDLSVVIPAYNEEATIAEVIEEAEDSLRDSGYRYEVVVLDDGSTDRTWALLNSLSERIPSLRLLRHERNQGIMASLQDLYQAAEGRAIFNQGADRQWKTADVLRMLPLTGQYDIIVGKRREKHYNWWRSIVSSQFNVLPILLFGVATHDAGSNKLIPRKLVRELALISKGPFREAERLIRAAARGYRIGAIPVETAPRRAGVSTGARLDLVWLSVLDLFRCWWQIRVLRKI